MYVIGEPCHTRTCASSKDDEDHTLRSSSQHESGRGEGSLICHDDASDPFAQILVRTIENIN